MMKDVHAGYSGGECRHGRRGSRGRRRRPSWPTGSAGAGHDRRDRAGLCRVAHRRPAGIEGVRRPRLRYRRVEDRRVGSGGAISGMSASTRSGRPAAKGRFAATADFARLGEADAVLICVPTPLDGDRNPISASSGRPRRGSPSSSARHAGGPGIHELPGTCRDVVRPILEAGGLRSGENFFWLTPRNARIRATSVWTATIPRVVAGAGPVAWTSLRAVRQAVSEVVPVASLEVAEAVKITENVFRAVKIALVNELKTTYEALGIDVWHVIAGASSKPIGYMPFYPGPGLGGHCLPVDPFHLAGRRVNMASRAGLSNWPARSTTTCLAASSNGSRARSGGPGPGCRRRVLLSAWPTSATSTTSAKAPGCA